MSTGVARRGQGSIPGVAVIRRWVADETWIKRVLTAQRWMSRAYFEARYLAPDPWHLATSPYERERARASMQLLEGRHYASVIEVGCGEGTFTSHLLGRGDHVVAVDFSALALRRARRRFDGEPRVEIRQIDVRSEDMDRTFDLVFCAELFYYFTSAEREIVGSRLARWVGPGGDLCLVHGTSVHDLNPAEEGAGRSGCASARGIHERFRGMAGLTVVRDLALPRYQLTLLRRIGARRG
jgi:SAM-dependent methyltransferase